VLTDAIVARSPLRDLQFPPMSEPLPVYPAGAVRCYRLPLAFTGTAPDQPDALWTRGAGSPALARAVNRLRALAPHARDRADDDQAAEQRPRARRSPNASATQIGDRTGSTTGIRIASIAVACRIAHA